MDTIGEIMTKKVVMCNPSNSIMDVRELMRKHRINRIIVVVGENKPLGIITQKDIIRFITADKSDRGLDEIPVKEAMSKELVTADPTTPISGIAKSMVAKKISSVIITDKDDTLIGVATKADLCLYFVNKEVGVFKVHDYMSPNPTTIRPSQPIFQVVYLMSEHGISRVIVVDNEQEPIGIITLADLTMTSSLLNPATLIKERKPILVEGGITLPSSIHLLTARDIMTANPIPIEQSADLSDAARLMTRHSISGLPVKNESGKLVGIITKSDIIQAIASIRE